MAGSTHFVYCSAVFYLFIFVLLCCTIYRSPELPVKRVDLGLESLAVYRSTAAAINLQTSTVTKLKLTTMSVPLGWKKHLLLKIFKLFLASQCVLLSGDVMLNPGQLSNESFSPSEQLGFGNESFSSMDSESGGHDSFGSQFNTSTSSLDDFEPHLYFNLDLLCKGLRIGHWNVNHLTSSKFDQIKLFLKNKDGTPQVDVLWLNETFLKPDIPDSLYSVPGFTIFWRNRQIKNDSGILAFINDELSAIRRTDLEDSNFEILWLEIAPFKFKRSLTHFYVNVSRSNGNPTWCTFQSYSVMFSRQKLTHAYFSFKSYVGREGHLYKVFLVSAMTCLT